MTGAERGAQGEGAPGQGEEAAAAWTQLRHVLGWQV
jgi:hypothetical protein